MQSTFPAHRLPKRPTGLDADMRVSDKGKDPDGDLDIDEIEAADDPFSDVGDLIEFDPEDDDVVVVTHEPETETSNGSHPKS